MTLWETKLAAWLHDPAEKALVLLRDKTGHEWGTVAELREMLFGCRVLPSEMQSVLKRADWYGAAADRPQWPLEENGARYAAWTQVDFAERPVLIHPLTGEPRSLDKLTDIAPAHLKSVSLQHFERWIVRDGDGKPDLQKTLLAYWRFGPTTPAPDLHHLWQNLPADTRVPDHSIWEHLGLVSAFAGAMAADENGTPALLAVSFGPVQGFIAEARTTSDLWAGSHLLARISWEGMKVVCERLGPDAILFPSLRGVPLADAWLRDGMGLPDQWFHGEDWHQSRSDANPLYLAALPNRFVAIVPADQATELALAVARRTRDFVADLGERALRRILKEIGEAWRDDLPCVAQMREQLADFPEAHWAAVPWSLAEGPSGGSDDKGVRRALSGFYPVGEKLGFLDSDAWGVLSKAIELDRARFYDPNPGTLYPALYDLLDRVASAAKTVRPFAPLRQTGYRSSLNGEREWLTLADVIPDDVRPADLPPGARYLDLPPGRRGGKAGQVPTLWTRLPEKEPSWVKLGEHLDALATIKRLWPTLFTEEVEGIVGREVRRYVVSTHTLALAVSLEQWLGKTPRPQMPYTLRNLLESPLAEHTALPRRIATRLAREDEDAHLLCRKLPGVLDALKEQADTGGHDAEARERGRQAEEMLASAERDIKELFGAKPETYYGILLFDGDRMGAWLSGSTWKEADGATVDPRLTYAQSWHEQIRESDAVRGLRSRNPALDEYLNSRRPPSPGRHGAISRALNHFSTKTARFVVEDCFKGKLVYAGGDDVLAFVCVDDLLPAITLLRCLYSGLTVPAWLHARLDSRNRSRFDSANGWLRLDEDLLLTMGERATASCGAVVAHHQAPLGLVLRTLREAEAASKKRGGRDAFNLRILKRAGGEVGVTDRWFRDEIGAAGLLDALMRMLAREGVSRRAAYHSVEWLARLPEKPAADLLRESLAYQFTRQGGERELGFRLADYATRNHPAAAPRVLTDFLMTAEFLARNSRHPEASP